MATSYEHHQARRKEFLQMAGRAQRPSIWRRKSGLNNTKGDSEKKREHSLYTYGDPHKLGHMARGLRSKYTEFRIFSQNSTAARILCTARCLQIFCNAEFLVSRFLVSERQNSLQH